MPAQWYTPTAYMKNREEAWAKIERGSWQPPKLQLEKEITYFNNVRSFQRLPEYDLYFSFTKTFPLWDKRKSRDNRCYLPDIRNNIFQQENPKSVPVLSSMMYGRGSLLEVDAGTFRRKCTRDDLERRRGVITEKDARDL